MGKFLGTRLVRLDYTKEAVVIETKVTMFSLSTGTLSSVRFSNCLDKQTINPGCVVKATTSENLFTS